MNNIKQFLLITFMMLSVFGQAQNIVYVSSNGSNSNSGTWNAPVQTISHALSLANGINTTHIRIAAGVYETTTIELKSHVILDGCWIFDANDGTWTKNTSDSSVIYIDALETDIEANRKVGFRSENKTDWYLQDIIIDVAGANDAVDRNASGKGTSVYGVYISGNASNTHIIACTIRTGDGGNGADGIDGNAGQNGNNGNLGHIDKVGVCYGGDAISGAPAVGSGYRSGGAGGNSGGGRNGNPLSSGATGNAGSNGSNGGNGASGGTAGASCSKNTDGNPGGNGSLGTNGITPNTYQIPSWGTYFIPGNKGGTGSDGAGGGGGGGGGSAGSASFVGSWSGGSGGSGGEGGTGGTGGIGGGSSFVIYCYNTNAPQIINTILINGRSGNGGIGGDGGSGGTGGAGGEGYNPNISSCDNAKIGGRGGNGGNGGNGGRGEDGATGFSYEFINVNTDGTFTTPTLPIVTLQPIITAKYSGYTNSQIVLTRTSGTWDLDAGLQIIKDILPDSTTYTENSSTIVVTAVQTGKYTIDPNLGPIYILKEKTLGELANIPDTIYYEDTLKAIYSDNAQLSSSWILANADGSIITESSLDTLTVHSLSLTTEDEGKRYYIGFVADYRESYKTDYLWKSFLLMPKEVNVSISDTLFVYDGSPREVTITTDNNLENIVTYNGSTTPPTDAGVYTVVAKVITAGYKGIAYANLTIEKAPANTIIFSTEEFTFDSLKKQPVITTVPNGLNYTLTFNNDTAAINAGTYNVVATIDDNNYYGKDSTEMIIRKAQATILFDDLRMAYNESAQGATITTNPTGLHLDITYNNNIAEPVKIGKYTVKAVVIDDNYEGEDSTEFVITKGLVTIFAEDSTLTYDGNQHELAVSVQPNAPYTVTYNGLITPPTDAGRYSVVVSIINDSIFQTTSKIVVMTIEKAVAEITLSNDTLTYNGSEQEITVITNPEGLNYNSLYNNSYIKPSLSGSYNVEITIHDKNYTGKKDTVLTIKKAEAEINYSSLTQKYTGNSIVPEIRTNPEEINSITTYNGSPTLPINAGKYVVRTVINDTNYFGTGEDTLTIEKADALINLSNLVQTYTGSPLSPTITTSPSLLNVDLLYEGNAIAINAGKYEVLATVNDNNYQGTLVDTLVIEKANVSFEVSNNQLIYDDGQELSATITTIPANIAYGVTYNNNPSVPTDTGAYLMHITSIDNNYQGDTTHWMYINLKPVQIHLNDTLHTYDGDVKFVSVSTTPAVNYELLYSQNGDQITHPVDAGFYDVSIRITEDYHEAVTRNAILEIEKAHVQVSGDSIQYFTYDSTRKSVSFSITPDAPHTVFYYKENEEDTISPVDAGKYDVRIHIHEANCHGHIVNRTMIIEKAQADIVFDNLSFDYDGQTKTATVTTNPQGLPVSILYNGAKTPPVSAGKYKVEATINHYNYEGTVIDTLEIRKTVSVEEFILTDNQIVLYPNPARKQVVLEINGITAMMNIRIVDSHGKQLRNDVINCVNSHKETMDISNYPPGIYIVLIQYQDKRITKKLIVY